jgi:hypothetical protein
MKSQVGGPFGGYKIQIGGSSKDIRLTDSFHLAQTTVEK